MEITTRRKVADINVAVTSALPFLYLFLFLFLPPLLIDPYDYMGIPEHHTGSLITKSVTIQHFLAQRVRFGPLLCEPLRNHTLASCALKDSYKSTNH